MVATYPFGSTFVHIEEDTVNDIALEEIDQDFEDEPTEIDIEILLKRYGDETLGTKGG